MNGIEIEQIVIIAILSLLLIERITTGISKRKKHNTKTGTVVDD